MRVEIGKGKPKEISIQIPPSKSMMHRHLIAASLASGTSKLLHYKDNEDTIATKNALMHLGATFEMKDDTLIVQGVGKDFRYDLEVVDCNESGSTLRFLIPIFSLTKKEVVFTGKKRLLERPQSVYEEIFNANGLRFEKDTDNLIIEGALAGDNYKVQGNISSQFISGLLFTLPLLSSKSTIELVPPIESASYIFLTIDVLKKAGIQIEWKDNMIYIPGNQSYVPFEAEMEADDSQAAFFIAYSLLNDIPITISNISHHSKQGDHVMLKIVRDMGADVIELRNGYRIEPNVLKPCEIDLKDCPDLGPILFALASQIEGKTKFINTERLRIKESDRIQAMADELNKIGCFMEISDNEVEITGKQIECENGIFDGHNDHRIVMALSILLSSNTKKNVIQGTEAVSKSYPDFFQDLEKTGVDITYDI